MLVSLCVTHIVLRVTAAIGEPGLLALEAAVSPPERRRGGRSTTHEAAGSLVAAEATRALWWHHALSTPAAGWWVHGLWGLALVAAGHGMGAELAGRRSGDWQCVSIVNVKAVVRGVAHLAGSSDSAGRTAGRRLEECSAGRQTEAELASSRRTGRSEGDPYPSCTSADGR